MDLREFLSREDIFSPRPEWRFEPSSRLLPCIQVFGEELLKTPL